jgi:YggT family protein
MLILGRLYWFLNWALITAIVTVIVLMVLRLIANQLDLNPFSWSARTIRRLTDPLINPVRRGLSRLGVDPKYAPLVAVLLAILVGWFALQLLSSIANTLAGVLFSLQAATPIATIGYVLYGLVSFYILLIFIRIIFSYGMINYRNAVMRFMVNATDPMLLPLRRIVPMAGAFDISPLVAFIILWLVQAAIAGTLLRGFPLVFF